MMNMILILKKVDRDLTSYVQSLDLHVFKMLIKRTLVIVMFFHIHTKNLLRIKGTCTL